MEGNQAAMSGYCYEAQRFGIDVVWISDHDNRYFRQPAEIDLGADYEMHLLRHPDKAIVSRSDGSNPRLAFRVQGREDFWQGMAVRLPYVRKSMCPPLIVRPEIDLRLRSNFLPGSRNRRLTLRLHLGATPPDHRPIFLDYVLGAYSREEHVLPLSMDKGKVRLSPYDDFMALGELPDHNVNNIELLLETRRGTEARAEIQSFSIKEGVSDPNVVLEKQTELAQQLGQLFGVTVFVNYEASAAEGHMTCFGPALPIPYAAERRLTRAEIAGTIKERGGIVSINHPFSAYKRETLDQASKAALVRQVADNLIACRADGARLLEVGFPEGRHDFDVSHYLSLLDRLNCSGLRMTAIGVSDAHANRGWERGNNFANYIASPDCRMENLLSGLRAGNHYMADPARVRGLLQIGTDQGRSMGEVQGKGRLMAQISDIPPGCEWRWVIDGRCQAGESASGSYRGECALEKSRHFVRGELWDPYERLILATNPVWAA